MVPWIHGMYALWFIFLVLPLAGLGFGDLLIFCREQLLVLRTNTLALSHKVVMTDLLQVGGLVCCYL